MVDPDREYQTIDGFGASITDSSAAVLAGLTPTVKAETMRTLFDPVRGIGVSFLRQPIGATDFSRSFYTYNDGAADPSLSRFSIAHDNA